MEVAGQWRREWAGTAEYGKMTSGGVTRRVARALEVLHASAPGARVRVMRAAYHSAAAPGAPAASYVLHSSRRVISSGSSFLESPTFMSKPLESPSYITKPLEISSLPLESSPERYSEAEDYKVTEPDDLEISEPSKWRPAAGAAGTPHSEDSSSADTASLVDLDSRTNKSKHTHLFRKWSFDSDNSGVHSFKKTTCRLSPLLDVPVTLSTLKYKSLLNGTSDHWNDRRKSYSFEDTSPLSGTMIHTNDTLAMESSTDSGICKSTEIVNDQTEYNNSQRFLKKDNFKIIHEGSFKGWLARNRAPSIRRESPLKYFRETRVEDLGEDKIALQSAGKVSITIPMNNDDTFQFANNYENDEADRRIKRVEFCKTEVHFAADSGTVNIIATDDKPPSSNDFRKRRSAFVPMTGNYEKPITLFEEKSCDQSEADAMEISDKNGTCEFGSTTKSILKNKITKPKPYLLGENMMLETKSELLLKNDPIREYIIPTTVSLINTELQPDDNKYYIGLSTDKIKQSVDIAAGLIQYHASRTKNNGPVKTEFRSEKNKTNVKENIQANNKNSTETIQPATVKQKLKHIETSPMLVAKTRPLRDSDLTYFGVSNSIKTSSGYKTKNRISSLNSDPNDYLKSVKLIQQVSSSVCNSEAESEDHDYQNILFRNESTSHPKDTEKIFARGKDVINKYSYDHYSPGVTASERVRYIKPVIEEDYKIQETRRSRSKQGIVIKTANRSISEPPKHRMPELSPLHSTYEKSRKEKLTKCIQSTKSRDKDIREVPTVRKSDTLPGKDIPLYVNINERNKIQAKYVPVPSRRSRTLAGVSDPVTSISAQNPIAERNDGSLNSKSNFSEQFQEEHGEKTHSNRNIGRKVTDNVDKISQRHKKSNNERSSLRTQSSRIDKGSLEKTKPMLENQDVSGSYSRRNCNEHRVEAEERKRNSTISDKKLNNESVKNTEVSIINNEADKGLSKTNGRERCKSKEMQELNKDPTDTITVSQSTKVQKKHVQEENESRSRSRYTNPKRKEYVINYDDKNGTVSSICKVKSGTSRRKTNNKENKNEYSKEIRTNTKSTDKRSLRK